MFSTYYKNVAEDHLDRVNKNIMRNIILNYTFNGDKAEYKKFVNLCVISGFRDEMENNVSLSKIVDYDKIVEEMHKIIDEI